MLLALHHRKDAVLALALITAVSAVLAALATRQDGGVFRISSTTGVAPVAETVRVAPVAFQYRVAGSFLRDGQPANAPLVRIKPASLTIMRAQVSEAAYEACVRAGACRAIARRTPPRGDLPITGVSFNDASDYARWFSGTTGESWRLPSDEEWAFAAGSKATDDAIDVDSADFSQRWLKKYEQEAGRARESDRTPHAIGSFGANEHGLLDLAGNVWEWTQTCYSRHSVDAAGRASGEPVVNCGVRVLQGAHRTYVSSFIRDARAGGCSVGVPPDNLGFRLVRDDVSWLERGIARMRKGLGLA
jgi:formylglycine-generating enzyme required for sulfatase activity